MRRLAFAVLLLLGACNAPQKAREPAPSASQKRAPLNQSEAPESAAACKARCNGEFGQHGLMPKPHCLCRTNDAGTVCESGADCEGQCVFDSALTQVTEPGPPPRGYYRGRCSEFKTTFGCNALLPRTKPEAPVEVFDPPPSICID